MNLTRNIVLLFGCVWATTLVAATDRQPQPTTAPNPVCPFAFYQQKIPGYAVAEFTVSVAGRVQDLRTIEATNKDFEMSVLVTVSRWKFKTALKDGKPVEARLRYRFTFRPGEKEAEGKAEPLAADATGSKPAAK